MGDPQLSSIAVPLVYEILSRRLCGVQTQAPNIAAMLAMANNLPEVLRMLWY
jgi:hypothetical protein